MRQRKTFLEGKHASFGESSVKDSIITLEGGATSENEP
jgi:hypothetical protein